METQLGLLLQGAQDDFVEAHVNLHFARGWLDFLGGQFAGEEFVEDHAEAVDVRAMVGAAVGLLLRGHVLRCAGDGGGGEIGCRRWFGCASSLTPALCPGGDEGGGFATGRGVAEHLGDAEVGDFDAARFVEKEVFGLDVAVDYAVLVRVLQRLADGWNDGQRLLGREAAGAHRLPEIHAVHELHEEEVEWGMDDGGWRLVRS